ncbi:hypothetical protein ACGFW5_01880 [Streptomyces sp. NPDC048416]|uniref:hypothetical protein n=1 Tax=Streptomyces sp. NPDC048416 TaxID=3365546 RepID=UPI00371F10F1
MKEKQEVSEADDLRYMFMFYPPVDDAGAWQMTVDGFAHALSRAFPGAFTKYRTSSLRGNSVVDFEAEVLPQVWVEGVASTPVENSAVITVVGATVTEAAHFALWLRSGLAPRPDLVRFSSEPALEGGDDSEWVIPAGGGFEEVRAALAEHMKAVDGE